MTRTRYRRESPPTYGTFRRAVRWLTPDPAGQAAVDITDPQTWNGYAYVRNNPLALVDPMGLDGECAPGATLPCTATVTATAPSTLDLLIYQLYFGWYCGMMGICGQSGFRGGGPGPGGGGVGGASSTTKPPASTQNTQPRIPASGFSSRPAEPAAGCCRADPSCCAPIRHSYGGGTFFGTGRATSGTFASGGGTSALSGFTGNYPANGTRTSNVGLGGFGGVGGGVFVTNAGNSTTLRGPFTSIIASIGIFGLELDFSGGIWVVSATVGKSTGGGFVKMQTNTFATACQ